MRPLARGVHQHRARAVHDVTGRHLPAARLQHVGRRAPAVHAYPAVDAEDGADRGVDVDVGGAVERIEEDGVLADWVFGGNRDDVLVFLRTHYADPPGVLQAVLDGLVGEDIELLLLLALHVQDAGGAKDVDQAGAADCGGDDLGRERDVVEQIGQLPRRLGVAVLLIENEALDGGDGRLHEPPGEMRMASRR